MDRFRLFLTFQLKLSITKQIFASQQIRLYHRGQEKAKIYVQMPGIAHQQMVDSICCVCFFFLHRCTKQPATSGSGFVHKLATDARSHIPVNQEAVVRHKSNV